MNVMINSWFPMALHRRICEWCGCDNYEPDNNNDGGSRGYAVGSGGGDGEWLDGGGGGGGGGWWLRMDAPHCVS
jgi:hypothetical protein